MKKVDITVNELFSGIGAQKRGIDLTRLFNCKVISTSDIDKEAMVSYAAIHCGLTKDLIDTYDKYPSKEEMAKLLSDRNIGYDFKKDKPYDWFKHVKQKNKTLEKYYLACILSDNLGDISLIEELPYADFWTYSFPCQDISVAGLQAGIKEGTRSGLLKEVERLLEVADKKNIKPKFLLLENVKNLVGKNNKPDFDVWLSRLDELGYNTHWKVVNGKDCGIPQNRERTFAISVRKDVDTGLFEFNKPFDNGLRLRDLLDETVDEKYYISEDKLDRFITDLNSNNALMYDSCRIKREGKLREYNDYSPTLNSRDYKDLRLVNENNIKQLGNYRKSSGNFDNPQTEGGDRQPKILENLKNRRIRKLTPAECFRLMGFTYRDIQLCMEMDVSDSQLYKEAGNSIITYCIKLIMEHLYKALYNNTYICTDEIFLNGETEDINFTQPQAV